jgi:protein-disulfide isomerase
VPKSKADSLQGRIFGLPGDSFLLRRPARRFWCRSVIARTCALIYALLAISPTWAQTSGAPPDQALVEQVTAAVLEALQQDGKILDQAIDRGIQRFLDRQKAAQAKAKAEQARVAEEKAKKVRRPSADRDHIRGNPDAKISLIEYSDFECPFCKRFHDTPKKLLETHGDQVNWIYRHFPLSFHNPNAQKEAEASECVAEIGGPDKFWLFTDAIYDRTRSGGKGFAIDKLAPLVTELGLDGNAFQECLDSGRKAERVAEDLKEGASIGISGTPGSVLLNNETGEVRLIQGARGQSAFDIAIRQLLSGRDTAKVQ